MKKIISKREEVTTRVTFSYTACDLPFISNKNKAMYEGHARFVEWFNLESPSISLSRFPYEVFTQTVSYETDEDGHEHMVSINKEPLK